MLCSKTQRCCPTTTLGADTKERNKTTHIRSTDCCKVSPPPPPVTRLLPLAVRRAAPTCLLSCVTILVQGTRMSSLGSLDLSVFGASFAISISRSPWDTGKVCRRRHRTRMLYTCRVKNRTINFHTVDKSKRCDKNQSREGWVTAGGWDDKIISEIATSLSQRPPGVLFRAGELQKSN